MKQFAWMLIWMLTAVTVVANPLQAADRGLLTDEEENQLIAASYDQALASESRDREWAEVTERQARDAVILRVDEGVSMVDVVCATSFCRASLKLESAGNESVVEALATTEPFNTAGWIRYHEDSDDLSLYFVRPGYSLPGAGPNGL